MRLMLLALVLWVSAGYAIPGDLNMDGTVDFDDFFVFADNFGKSGPPIDTVTVTTYDTLTVEIETVVHDTPAIDRVTVYDTVTVEFSSPPTDTPEIPETQKDYFISNHYGNELAHIEGELWGSYDSKTLTVYACYRVTIDSDDEPWLYVNYNDIPVITSTQVRYVPIATNDSLQIVTGDTLEIMRSVEWLSTALRFSEVADTRGDRGHLGALSRR